ncbi:MAG: hypothetical protein KG012_03770 [Deltaproteobacteria bacterium]|nr:hypothetical protein [Syntrophaceae bacterium]MBS3917988.1 hypothetical protein [Deltaproteobacteria bacterium]
MNHFIYCEKRECRLNVSICLARGCSHLKNIEEEFLCRFLSKKDQAVKKRLKKVEKARPRKEERDESVVLQQSGVPSLSPSKGGGA